MCITVCHRYQPVELETSRNQGRRTPQEHQAMHVTGGEGGSDSSTAKEQAANSLTSFERSFRRV